MGHALHSLYFLIFPLVFVFAIFNLGHLLVGKAVFNHPIARHTYSLFGLIGTPTHELSHLVMALLFGHKITGVKLFSWRTKAYVRHSYNASSSFQVMGNFFIAIAPFMTSIALVHYLAFRSLNFTIDLSVDPFIVFGNALTLAPELLLMFAKSTEWWQFALAIMLSFYCVPSNTDFSNALRSALLSVPVFLIMAFVGTMVFVDMGQIVGTVLFMGLLSSITSVIWWFLLFGLTFIPTRSMNH